MSRIGLPLLIVNYLAFGVFIASRPSESQVLRTRDAAWNRGEFWISSADPYTYIAGRPLYNWSPWHGGERLGVKILEVINLPALLLASALTPIIGMITGASHYYSWSWIRAVLFLLFATFQWLILGSIISRLRHNLDMRPNSG